MGMVAEFRHMRTGNNPALLFRRRRRKPSTSSLARLCKPQNQIDFVSANGARSS